VMVRHFLAVDDHMNRSMLPVRWMSMLRLGARTSGLRSSAIRSRRPAPCGRRR
jgi:hypothetical protein